MIQVNQQHDDCEIKVGLVKMIRSWYTKNNCEMRTHGDGFVWPTIHADGHARRAVSRVPIVSDTGTSGEICQQRLQAVCAVCMERESCLWNAWEVWGDALIKH